MRISHIVLILIMLFGFILSMSGQQVVVQVINGKTNKPVSKAKLLISFPGGTKPQSLELFTDQNGEAAFSLDGSAQFEIHPIALVTCGEQPPGAKQPTFSVSEILQSGVLTKNDCGHSEREPIRGRVVYFVRTAGWWELFRN